MESEYTINTIVLIHSYANPPKKDVVLQVKGWMPSPQGQRTDARCGAAVCFVYATHM